jgi:hypothetical protein
VGHLLQHIAPSQVFFGSNGGGYGWARRAGPKTLTGQALTGIDASNLQRDGYSNGGRIQEVPTLGGTNFAFNKADGYHFGWARKQQPNTPAAKSPRAQKSLMQVIQRLAARTFVYETRLTARVSARFEWPFEAFVTTNAL